MSSDHETTLVNKLKKLTNSSQSIQSLSLWIIYHAQKYRESVGVWTREIHKAKPKQKLTLLYLANDVMQNSKKKTQDFVNEFAAVLPEILQSSYHAMSSSEQGSVSRMVKIWEERSVLSSTQIGAIRKAMESGSSAAGSASATSIATAIPINHVVKALQDLDQIENENKPFKAEDSKIKQDYQSFLEKARNEKILTTMGLKELQSLRIEYDAHIKQLSALRSALTNENEKRNKYMQALRQELQQQSDQYHRLDEQIQTWNTYTMNIQNFLTKVEININQKKLEFEFDDRDNKKRGLHELSSSDNDDLVANIFGDDSHTGGGDVDDSHPFKKQKLDNSSSSNGVLQEYEPLMDVNKFMNEAAPQTDVSAILSAISTEEINDSTRGVYSMEQPFQVQLQRTGGMNHENSLGLGADFFSDDQNL